MLQRIKRTQLMHNISSIVAMHNMLQQHTCITSPGIHNIYKQKGAKHVQAHTYQVVLDRPYNTDTQKGVN
jgi:hypothetical protein